jgi:hypothetical protein
VSAISVTVRLHRDRRRSEHRLDSRALQSSSVSISWRPPRRRGRKRAISPGSKSTWFCSKARSARRPYSRRREALTTRLARSSAASQRGAKRCSRACTGRVNSPRRRKGRLTLRARRQTRLKAFAQSITPQRLVSLGARELGPTWDVRVDRFRGVDHSPPTRVFERKALLLILLNHTGVACIFPRPMNAIFINYFSPRSARRRHRDGLHFDRSVLRRS